MPRRHRRARVLRYVAAALAIGACASLILVVWSCQREQQLEQRTSLLTAYCEVPVIDIGPLEVETDYLPHVVTCENGNASFEALKAQAVAARSYLYYKLDTSGEIMDGTGDQVYSCGRSPSEDAYRAVQETSGQVVQYMGTQVAAFYVAGALQDPPSCEGGSDDPTSTEDYVTYNEGLSGDDIEQTSLGWINPGNHANRGCLSQNGSDCLSDDGWAYDAILRFYYGEDIELITAEGGCIGTAPMMPASDGGVTDDAGGAGNGGDGDASAGCAAGGGAGSTGLVLILVLLARRLFQAQTDRQTV